MKQSTGKTNYRGVSHVQSGAGPSEALYARGKTRKLLRVDDEGLLTHWCGLTNPLD
jgi:hypothetical protein